ncbi:hypothetical protein GCM10010124_05750 [Pilimelia terevasa]|uniref:PDGLE domain-containing protein n=1 Tax=Pilimelia terevasa TaxID=53372 RepID=A0A8J3BKP3_9ACTN|nr:PDGLE domain-containing protein [Pilimelia terevasa]GGK15971.1 hypothetical protein GCM10010124_05750 [Pilimelia terevasa]
MSAADRPAAPARAADRPAAPARAADRPGGAAPGAADPAPRPVRRGLLLGGLAVALVLAGLVSAVASGAPDGLEAALSAGCTVDDAGEVVAGTCPATAARPHEWGGPFADYAVAGLGPGWGTALAGVGGVLLTFACGAGLFRLARRRRAG